MKRTTCAAAVYLLANSWPGPQLCRRSVYETRELENTAYSGRQHFGPSCTAGLPPLICYV